ncbi:DUF6153 family protein [Streptomyces sp. NPDC056796]|uniref:DUF6153 family protein n=1 Tax=Streptomyces sp. NPDC056796 TaxID=3345947 RepID=UPI0036914DBA
MTRTQQRSVRPGRGFALLVLAVLSGLLAMHGLAPGIMAPEAGHAAMSGPSSNTTHTARAISTHRTGDACQHLTGTGTGGPMAHADATCAAAGISTSPAPPTLLPQPGDHTVTAVLPGWPATPAAAGRAPPDLAQLQLLRI